MGKTQFAMGLLAQLSRHSGSRFGIADFKNDYSNDTGFPAFAGAEFLDLWDQGAPYNPLALVDDNQRAIDTAVIELRDTVEEATRAFTRMGVRQKAKLEKALREAYAIGRQEGRWPTLRTLDDQLDADLAGVMGDLTRHELFKSGQPLGDVIEWADNTGNKLRPTQKPISVLLPLIETYSGTQDTVLDPFAGSGSSLVAAKMLGRNWLGVELDGNHHATAMKRLAGEGNQS